MRVRYKIRCPTMRDVRRALRRIRIKQMSTSKAVLALVLAWGVAAMTATLIVWMVRGDLPEVGTVVGVVAGVVATELGFYAWKAKAENIQKYGYKYEEE